MKLINRNCPICSSSDYQDLYFYKMYVREFLDHGPEVVKCNKCGMVYLNPVMDQKSYGVFYDNDTQRKVASSHIKEDYDEKTRLQTLYRIKKINNIISEESILLDIGCGLGDFIDQVGPFVKQAIGLEPSLERSKLARSKGLNVKTGDIFDWNIANKVDVVTMYQSLEHIIEPNPFFERLKMIMKPGGLLVIEVPNHNDFLVNIKAYRTFYYQNAHCSYFTGKTLGRLMCNNSFALEQVSNIQRYSLSNHLHWVLRKKPGSYKFRININKMYSSFLERTKKVDTLFCVYKFKG